MRFPSSFSRTTDGDVYVCNWDGTGEQRLTDVNRDWLSSVTLPHVERRRFAKRPARR